MGVTKDQTSKIRINELENISLEKNPKQKYKETKRMEKSETALESNGTQ